MQNLVSLSLMAMYREISKVFPIYALVQLVTPPRWSQLQLHGYNLGTLGRGSSHVKDHVTESIPNQKPPS